MLSETEENARLIHYFRGNVLFFPGKDCLNQAGGCVYHGVPTSGGSLVILSLENTTWCLLFKALECHISFQPRFWPHPRNSVRRLTMEITAENCII